MRRVLGQGPRVVTGGSSVLRASLCSALHCANQGFLEAGRLVEESHPGCSTSKQLSRHLLSKTLHCRTRPVAARPALRLNLHIVF